MEILVDLLTGRSPRFLPAAVRRVPLFIVSRVKEPRHITYIRFSSLDLPETDGLYVNCTFHQRQRRLNDDLVILAFRKY
jgi:hypothetical protein